MSVIEPLWGHSRRSRCGHRIVAVSRNVSGAERKKRPGGASFGQVSRLIPLTDRLRLAGRPLLRLPVNLDGCAASGAEHGCRGRLDAPAAGAIEAV